MIASLIIIYDCYILYCILSFFCNILTYFVLCVKFIVRKHAIINLRVR